MSAGRTSAGCLVALLASLPTARAQDWVMDVPGAPGDLPDSGIHVSDFLFHPDGEIVAVGSRFDSATGNTGCVFRIGLDATIVAAKEYAFGSGAGFSFQDASWGPGDTLVAVGHTLNAQALLPFLYSIDRTTGAVLWKQTPTFEKATLYASSAAGDGYVGVGTLLPLPGGSSDGYVVRVGSLGELLWQKRYDVFGTDESWRDVMVREDGHILIGGRSQSGVQLVELSAVGDPISARRFNVPGGQSLIRIEPTMDGGAFLATTSQHEWPHPRTAWVARLDAAGEPVWQFSYRTKLGDSTELLSTSDGGCVLAGILAGGGGLAPMMLRLDADGGILWARRFAQLSPDAQPHAVEICELPDGALVLSASSPDHVLGDRHLLLYRVGRDGEGDASCAGFGEAVPVHRSATNVAVVSQALSSSAVAEWEPDLQVFPVELDIDASLLCGDPCPAPSSYCGTTPNSVGAGALLAWTGSTSVAADDGGLLATGLPPGVPGLFFRSATQGSTPLGDGQLCVSQPVLRLGTVAADGAGQAELEVALTVAGQPEMDVLAGSEWHFQLWYRDLAGGPAGSNLSAGLAARFCP